MSLSIFSISIFIEIKEKSNFYFLYLLLGMKNNLLFVSMLALTIFVCGCNNVNVNQCSESEDCVIDEIQNELVAESDVNEAKDEEDNLVIAEKLEWDEQITVSAWDLDSPSVEAY